MLIASLEAFGLAPSTLDAIQQRYGPHLLPVQERAIRELRLLEGNDALILAPTSAGKTLIAELTILRSVASGRRALFVLPTRALVEDKVADLEEAYSSLGLRVVAGTRDRREHDWALRRHDFDVAVVVYEKLASLLVAFPDYLRDVGIVVLDEMQTLRDPVRGWHGHWILHCLREAQAAGHGPQVLGLTSDRRGAYSLAESMGCPILDDRSRPVPLLTGVLQGGVFHFEEDFNGPWGRQTWVFDRPAGSDWDDPEERRRHEMRSAALALLEEGARVVCFLPSKAECARLAATLAEELPTDPPPVLERLRALPTTTASAHLEPLLARRVAIHHGDLPTELRALVEEAARGGQLRCLVATTTLASGVNLPVDAALIDPRRWLRGLGGWVADRITATEWESMAGRAGRLLPGEPATAGRAALVATSPLEAQALIEVYFGENLERDRAELDPEGLPLWFLRMAGRAGSHGLPPEAAELASDGADWALDELRDAELIDDLGHVTGRGHIAAAYGLSPATMLALDHWAETLPDAPADGDLLLGLCCLPAARQTGFPPPSRSIDGAGYAIEFWRRTRGGDPPADASLPPQGPARLTVILLDWLSDLPTREVEQRHRALGGAMSRLGQEVGRLAAAGARLLRDRDEALPTVERLETLADALSLDVPLAALGLGSLAPRGMPRDTLLALAARGATGPEGVLELGADGLAACVPPWLTRVLLTRAQRMATERLRAALWAEPAPAAESKVDAAAPRLQLRRRRPNEVAIGDHVVPLTRLQYDLLVALALRPRECVTWDELYQAMWNEGLEVQPEQISWHKRALVDRIATAVGHDRVAGLIRSIRGRGLMLDLPPEEVHVA